MREKRIEYVARFIDKYETITFVFPSEVSVEYPRRGYNGFFEWFTCGKADSETVAWEGLALTIAANANHSYFKLY